MDLPREIAANCCSSLEVDLAVSLSVPICVKPEACVNYYCFYIFKMLPNGK